MKSLQQNGYQILPSIYTPSEITTILHILKQKNIEQKFGIREFLKSNPELNPVIFNQKLKTLLQKIAPKAQVIKSIYFDKPPSANWIVNWHQDLTINVDRKIEAKKFKNWRVLKERTIVQPPLEILENIFTIRIHLDDCTVANGALRIFEKSHQLGVIRLNDGLEKFASSEKICEVPAGGVLIMKPLLLHASRRTENNLNRRVIHIEFCDKNLPSGLDWKENQSVF